MRPPPYLDEEPLDAAAWQVSRSRVACRCCLYRRKGSKRDGAAAEALDVTRHVNGRLPLVLATCWHQPVPEQAQQRMFVTTKQALPLQ